MKRAAAALLSLLAIVCAGERERRVPPRTLYRQGRTALWQGNFDHADALALRGLADSKTDAGWCELFSLLQVDAMARRGGDYQRALDVIDRTPVSGNAEASVRRLISRGYALTQLSRGDAAMDAFARADAMAARVDPSLRAEIALLAISPPFKKKDWTTAERFARDALDRGRAAKEPFVVANAMGMLGTIEMNREQYQAALDDLDAAHKLAHSIGARSTEMTILGNRGWCTAQLGDDEEALRSFVAVQRICEEIRLLRTQPTWLANIAAVYVSRRQYADAMPYAKKAVQVARRLHDDSKIAGALDGLVDIDLALKRYDAARALNGEALAIERRISPGAIPDSLLHEARLAAATGAPQEALRIVEPVIAHAGTAAQRWGAQAIAASAYRQLGLFSDAEKMYAAALASGDSVRDDPTIDFTYKLAFESNLLRVYDEYIDLLAAQHRPLDALRVSERSRARALRAGTGSSEETFAPVELAKRKQAVILCYWLAPERSLLWVVSANGVSLIELPPASQIEPDVDVYVRDLAAGRNPLAGSRGTRLYDMLVAPAMRIAPAQRVIVIPDGRLNALNLETLVVRGPKPRYWIEDATVSYAPSLQLVDAPRRAAHDQSVLVVGNVPAAGAEFPALPRAGEEIASVARHFTSAVILSGAHATPAAYLGNHPQQFAFVHFVAHSTANTRTPLESAVVLANGRLSGRQIAGAPLDADLVTVSSCSSAGKRSYAGEGLVGLAWAFLRAGAHRVIATQWDVTDRATPALMDKMYASLASGSDPAHALRDAKLALLHSDSVYDLPAYWAPFVIYGAA